MPQIPLPRSCQKAGRIEALMLMSLAPDSKCSREESPATRCADGGYAKRLGMLLALAVGMLLTPGCQCDEREAPATDPSALRSPSSKRMTTSPAPWITHVSEQEYEDFARQTTLQWDTALSQSAGPVAAYVTQPFPRSLKLHLAIAGFPNLGVDHLEPKRPTGPQFEAWAGGILTANGENIKTHSTISDLGELVRKQPGHFRVELEQSYAGATPPSPPLFVSFETRLEEAVPVSELTVTVVVKLTLPVDAIVKTVEPITQTLRFGGMQVELAVENAEGFVATYDGAGDMYFAMRLLDAAGKRPKPVMRSEGSFGDQRFIQVGLMNPVEVVQVAMTRRFFRKHYVIQLGRAMSYRISDSVH